MTTDIVVNNDSVERRAVLPRTWRICTGFDTWTSLTVGVGVSAIGAPKGSEVCLGFRRTAAANCMPTTMSMPASPSERSSPSPESARGAAVRPRNLYPCQYKTAPELFKRWRRVVVAMPKVASVVNAVP